MCICLSDSVCNVNFVNCIFLFQKGYLRISLGKEAKWGSKNILPKDIWNLAKNLDKCDVQTLIKLFYINADK